LEKGLKKFWIDLSSASSTAEIERKPHENRNFGNANHHENHSQRRNIIDLYPRLITQATSAKAISKDETVCIDGIDSEAASASDTKMICMMPLKLRMWLRSVIMNSLMI